jgi:DNA polymerase-4
MSRALLLIDMDAFYASVEQARHPEFVGLPVIVGGKAESRGVVSTCSYKACTPPCPLRRPSASARRPPSFLST